ncbi:MAG: DUF962 domain-containing protein [Cyanobacteria bacterium SZAS LIN-2]|nr:DUF962 domain-containing protein [Cyanobacteria bacterium SZAS LIN-3]MBS1995369.1 DUF962 domain-containing protein [Cyanobacteria bacterium SZAS LIN-2]
MNQALYKSAARSAVLFVKDYAERHRDPVNAALHLVGVPAVFYGLFQATAGRSLKVRGLGVACIVIGYVFQYLGHKHQGNEVGEVSLIKFLLKRVREASLKRMRSYNWSHASTVDSDEDEAQPVGSGAKAGVKKNGNGHHGGNGNGSHKGRYIMWWKTSH